MIPEHYVSQEEVSLVWGGVEIKFSNESPYYDKARFLFYAMRWQELFNLWVSVTK